VPADVDRGLDPCTSFDLGSHNARAGLRGHIAHGRLGFVVGRRCHDVGAGLIDHGADPGPSIVDRRRDTLLGLLDRRGNASRTALGRAATPSTPVRTSHGCHRSLAHAVDFLGDHVADRGACFNGRTYVYPAPLRPLLEPSSGSSEVTKFI
jgi:hypothetical protein